MPEKSLQDIHDIKPPVPLPAFGAEEWLYPLLMGLALIGLITGLILFLRRRRRKGAQDLQMPLLSPEERADRALDELREVERFRGKEFYFRLTMILREYIRGKYSINAPEMTTEELLPHLKRLPLDEKSQQEIRKMLLDADPVKFADQGTTENRMRRDHGRVRELVHDSREDLGPEAAEAKPRLVQKA